MATPSAVSFEVISNSVPTITLVVISVLVPGGLFVAAAVHAAVCRAAPLREVLTALFWLCVALAQALVASDAIANTVKVWLSFPRPNFFAQCNYKEFVTNVTAYLAATQPGQPGDPSLCLNAWDAQRSFPSGHATTSTAGMVVAALFLRAAFRLQAGDHFGGPAALAAASPLVIAVWISISRVRGELAAAAPALIPRPPIRALPPSSERWHNVVDILGGALLGAGCAALAWAQFEARSRGRGLLPVPAAAGAPADHARETLPPPPPALGLRGVSAWGGGTRRTGGPAASSNRSLDAPSPPAGSASASGDSAEAAAGGVVLTL